MASIRLLGTKNSANSSAATTGDGVAIGELKAALSRTALVPFMVSRFCGQRDLDDEVNEDRA